MDSTGPVYIYALVDPHTDEVRYIGKTTDLRGRYRRHCNPKRASRGVHFAHWLAQLHRSGYKPLLRVIEETTEEEWEERERAQIRLHREAGCNLVNTTEGGQGPLGLMHAKGPRPASQKLSDGDVRDICERIAHGERACDLAAEYAVSISHVCKLFKGQARTYVTDRPITGYGQKRGKGWTDRQREKIPASLPRGERCWRAKLTEESVRNIVERLRSGATTDELAQEYGVNLSVIIRIGNGSSWAHVTRDMDLPVRPRGHAKFFSHQVREIRARYTSGERAAVLAADFGVAEGTIYKMVARKTYASVT